MNLSDIFLPAPYTPDYEGREPPLTASHPSLVPTLCDVHTEGAVYVWYRLLSEGCDLDPEPCAQDALGGPPEWWNQEELGLEGILGLNWTSTSFQGHDFPDRWTRWALEEGIAPGQPFLLEIGKPRYFETGSYESPEMDCEYEVDIVRVLPRRPAQTLKAWTLHVTGMREHYEGFIELQKEKHRVQDEDLAAMTVTSHNYFAPGQSTLDDMEMPRGVRCCLESSHGPAQLVSGENDNGNSTKAFQAMWRNARTRRPEIDLARLFYLLKQRGMVPSGMSFVDAFKEP